MKKSILATVFAGTMMASAFASAAAIDSGTAITPTNCPLLGDQVVLNLSNNVSGAYNCDEATSVITVAACHKAGSRNPTTVNCTITSAAGVTPVVWNDSSCTQASDTFEIADYRGFTANSQGGKVAPEALGGACTESTVGALVN
ncbi:hypothetical protein [Stutzerimonas kunmingensis]|uniref:hypothetical protein n=1 Tax=Stutzerimonas kunmingensis TaxID=1211807 RepID=UPI00241E332A|nr:hypothetical protein [Stutzerimonas kunmingensis]